MKEFSAALMIAVAAVSLAACSSSSGPDHKPAEHHSATNVNGDPNQTWATPYKETSCDDWNNTMGLNEKFVAADDLLIRARTTQHIDSVPSNDAIDSFQKAIESTCQADGDLNLVEVAASVYVAS